MLFSRKKKLNVGDYITCKKDGKFGDFIILKNNGYIINQTKLSIVFYLRIESLEKDSTRYCWFNIQDSKEYFHI